MAGVSGLLVVVQRHAVYSALFLIITMGSLAGLYILLEAHFVWAVQVLVYAGAIMVLFLFVIMLLNLPREDVPWARRDLRRIMLALVLAGILLVELILVVGRAARARGQGARGRRRLRHHGDGRAAALQPVPVPVRDHVGDSPGRHRRGDGPGEEAFQLSAG